METAAKTIPILLQTLDLDLYPEGGDAGGRGDQPRLLRGAHAGGKAGRPGRGGRRRQGRRWWRAFAPSTRGAAASTSRPQPGGRYTLRVEQPVGHQDHLDAAGGAGGRGGPAGAPGGHRGGRAGGAGPGQRPGPQGKVTLSQREVELAATTVDLAARCQPAGVASRRPAPRACSSRRCGTSRVCRWPSAWSSAGPSPALNSRAAHRQEELRAGRHGEADRAGHPRRQAGRGRAGADGHRRRRAGDGREARAGARAAGDGAAGAGGARAGRRPRLPRREEPQGARWRSTCCWGPRAGGGSR